MTRTFVSLRRIAAQSVAITLFAAPIASAQTPEAAPAVAVTANTVLLGHDAFARLVKQPPAVPATAPLVRTPPRADLLRQVTAAMARQAQAAPAKAPQPKSWASRHKNALIAWSVIAGAVTVGIYGWYIYTDGFCC